METAKELLITIKDKTVNAVEYVTDTIKNTGSSIGSSSSSTITSGVVSFKGTSLGDTFFKNIQENLVGNHDNLTIAEQQLLKYENGYVPFSNVSLNKNKDDMFNSNNGSGNPIHRKTVSKLLNIDSRFRPNYSNTTSSNFILDLLGDRKLSNQMTISYSDKN